MFDPDQIDYIMGNPPFNGSRTMEKSQKAEVRAIAKGLKQAGFLDYVTAWYLLADRFLEKNPAIEVAFVSTNSISQGEQPAIFWPKLFKDGVHINFAHRTFRWSNGAPGQAHVYCVIIGFARKSRAQKQIFDYPDIKGEPILQLVDSINPYLVEGDEYVVSNRQTQISGQLGMSFGNMPADGGRLLFTAAQRDEFIKKEPAAEKWMKPCWDANALIQRQPRYCLWLVGISPSELKALPLVYERVAETQIIRANSSRPALASIPHLFAQVTQSPDHRFLLIPCHSSESRVYIPMGFFEEVCFVNSKPAI